MKWHGFASIVFVAYAGTASANTCVQTFNVYGPAYASSVKSRLERLGSEILQKPCELTLLQELWRETHFDHFKDSVKSLGYHFTWADHLRPDKLKTGLAQLVPKAPLLERSVLFTENGDGGIGNAIRDGLGVEKGYTVSRAVTESRVEVALINLHLHHSSDEVRGQQLKQLEKDLIADRSIEDLPWIIGGDFNATTRAKEMVEFKRRLKLRDALTEILGDTSKLCTYCESNPLYWGGGNRVIDHILVREGPRHRVRIVKAEINLKGTARAPLSDHFGVQAQIQFLPRYVEQVGEDREPWGPDVIDSN